MSDDLLLITRADARLLHPERVPTDLNAVVQGVLSSATPLLKRTKSSSTRLSSRASRITCSTTP